MGQEPGDTGIGEEQRGSPVSGVMEDTDKKGKITQISLRANIFVLFQWLQ